MKKTNTTTPQELNEIKNLVWSLLSFFRPTELKVFQYFNDVMQAKTQCHSSIKTLSIAIGISQKEVSDAITSLEKIGIIECEDCETFINYKILFKNLTSIHRLLLEYPIGFGGAIRNVISMQHKGITDITTIDINKAVKLMELWTE